MNDSLASVVGDALASIARECRPAYERMQRSLAGRTIGVRTEGELFSIDLGQVRPIDRFRADAAIDVGASARVIVRLLDGEISALDAILADDVSLRGAPDDLARFGDAAACFLRGALQCRPMNHLLDRLEHLVARKGNAA